MFRIIANCKILSVGPFLFSILEFLNFHDILLLLDLDPDSSSTSYLESGLGIVDNLLWWWPEST